MKAISVFQKKVRIIVLAVIAVTFITVQGYSQDTVKSPNQKKMKVIIKKDKHGISSVTDTTIYISGSMDDSSLKKALKEYEISLSGLEDDLSSMIVNISDLDLSDSAGLDSLKKMVKQIKVVRDKGGKHRSYDYFYNNFDHPAAPDMPPPPPPPPDCHVKIFDGYGDYEPFVESFRNREKTIRDVIGDIPMERVLNYSIKETKKGKKITIEVSDSPLLERDNNIIIIREPRHKFKMDRKRNPHMRKKVIIDEGNIGMREHFN